MPPSGSGPFTPLFGGPDARPTWLSQDGLPRSGSLTVGGRGHSIWGFGQGPLWGPSSCPPSPLCRVTGWADVPLRAQTASQPSAPPLARPQEPVGVLGGPPRFPARGLVSLFHLGVFGGVQGRLMAVLRCLFPMLPFPFVIITQAHLLHAGPRDHAFHGKEQRPGGLPLHPHSLLAGVLHCLHLCEVREQRLHLSRSPSGRAGKRAEGCQPRAWHRRA